MIAKTQTREAAPRKVVAQTLLQLRVAEVRRCWSSIAFSITSLCGYAFQFPRNDGAERFMTKAPIRVPVDFAP